MSYKQSHALLVAIDKYQNMSNLSTAVYGAEAFAELLSTTFEFQVTKFFNQNATEKNIIDWCRNLKCDKDDRVIFYFAGHGITRKSGSDEKGYLALFDSILEQYHTSLWIDSVINELDSLTAKHILIILDACFSGIVLQQSFITYRSADVTKESEEIYVNKLMNEQVRYVITAGRIELVDDNASPDGKMSLFTHFMLSGLRGDINTFSGLLTATELAVYIRNSVGNTNSAEHLPDFGHLRSSNRGEFIFRLPAAYVDIGSINSCNVEDGRSLLSNDEKLILEKLKRTKNLTVEEQITIGQSGSSVYLVNTVGYNPTAINGYHFCKVYRTITGEEAEIHKSVAKTSIGKYIPRLVDSTPHLDGWMASLYEVANQTTLRGSQSLSTLIKNNFVAARDTIVKLLNLLEIWNPLEKLVNNSSSSSPHSLLLRPLQRYTVANDSTDIDIVQRISYFVPEMVIRLVPL